jgi:NADH dehydrogenase
LSALRLWLAVGLLLPALPSSGASDELNQVNRWMPITTSGHLPASIALLSGGLLLVGLGTRYVGIGLILALSLNAMIDPRLTDAVYLLMLCALFITYGAGNISLDALFATQLKRRYPQLDTRFSYGTEGLPRVVIVGAGFGGISCAVGLRESAVAVTVIDRCNYHLFQPLLYQVATAALSPGDIAAPVRPLFRGAGKTRVLLGSVTAVDTTKRLVYMGDKQFTYD